jgi:FkbM family methyltransferase
MLAGAYETHVTRIIRMLLKPGDSFVDVGANIGYLSCVAATRVGPTGRILSFEPAPPYYTRLRRAREMNPRYQWDTFQVAVAQASGTAHLALSSRNIGWNTLVPGQIPTGAVEQVVSVPTVSLDAALASAGAEHVRLLKVDTEGYEGHVLLGTAGYLREARVDHILVEMLPSQYSTLGLNAEQVVGLLYDCGYEPYASRHPYHRLVASDLVDGTDVWFRGRGK